MTTAPRLHSARLPFVASRAGVGRLLALVACGLFVLSAVCFQPGSDALTPAAALLLSGGLALGAALRLLPHAGAPPVPPAPTVYRRVALLPFIPGALALAAVTIVSAKQLVPLFPQGISHHVQIVLFTGGIALIVWGLGGAPRLSLHLFPRQYRRELLVLAAITLVALALRLWQLGAAVHFFVDELNFALGVTQFWSRSNIELIMPRVMSFPGIYTYFQAGAVDIFGRNLDALRLVSVVVGTLAIPALYGLARILFDRTTAVAAALLLATLPPHIHFSRIGINNIADTLFGVLAFCCLARALSREDVPNRQLFFALAGAMLGMTQYFYEGGRAVFPLLAILWLGTLALAGRLRGFGRGVLVMTVTAALVAAPVYDVLAAMRAPMLTRMSNQGLDFAYWTTLFLASPDDPIVQVYLQHLVEPFLVYVRFPDASLFYGGDTPLLLVYIVPLVFLGLFHAVFRPRAGLWLAIFWIGLTSLGNTLLSETLHVTRYVVALPALALLAAAGLTHTLRLFTPSSTGTAVTSHHGGQSLRAPSLSTQPSVLSPFVFHSALSPQSLVLLFLALAQTVYYFGTHLDTYNRQFREADRSVIGQDAVFRALDFPYGTQAHLVTDPPLNAVYLGTIADFLKDGIWLDTLAPDDLTDAYLRGLPIMVGQAFFIEPENIELASRLSRRFNLQPPQFTPYNLPHEEALVLFYAPPPGAGAPPDT